MPVPVVPGTGTKLLSQPSKMPCYSFSLPAKVRCPGAVVGEGTVCGGCYAEKGRYLFANVRNAMAARAAWTEANMKTPEGRDAWVDAMVAAVTWSLRPIKAVRNESLVAYAAFVQRRTAAGLDTNRAWRKTFLREWRAAYRAAHGHAYRPTVTYRTPDRVFRVHDSGDLYSPRYALAWRRVAARLPDVRFWFPTRSWHAGVNPLLRAAVQQLATLPNVAVRPSALFLDVDPPVVEGLDAGTGVRKEGYTCPAHAQKNECRACRACWDKTLPVVYRLH